MNARCRPLMWIVVAGLAVPSVSALAQQAAPTFSDIPWVQGPTVGDLGTEAQVQVPEGCVFTGRDGVETFLELTHNPVGKSERGVVLCNLAEGKEPWFTVFSYSSIGYVRDDERDELDAAQLLGNITRATEASNDARRDRGWEPLTIEGWKREPYYDTETHNLTWALAASTPSGGRSVNHSVRILGRGGVMHVDLVADPAQLDAAMPLFGSLVSGFGYKAGHRYAEWREGDKVAEYGLAALVAGGAGVAAAKMGLFGKLWKLIVAAVAGAFAWLKSLFRRKERPVTARA